VINLQLVTPVSDKCSVRVMEKYSEEKVVELLSYGLVVQVRAKCSSK